MKKIYLTHCSREKDAELALGLPSLAGVPNILTIEEVFARHVKEGGR